MLHWKSELAPATQLNSDSRYRDFEIFQYWFMAVEKFAPWVNKVYLITDDQVPSWLEKFDKVVVLDHAEYIPQRYLPTFNSNTIELNLGRIKDLADHFVLFNDDTFLNADVQPNDFFQHGRPVDIYAESPIIATPGSIANTMVNNMTLINGNFSKKLFTRRIFRRCSIRKSARN